MNKIELRKVEVNSLMTLFSRSLKVSSVLDFKISSEKISSIVQNDASTFWKEWETETAGIFESDKFEETEVLIYNGGFFKDKVLPLFSKSKDLSVTIELNDEGHPVRLVFNDPGVLAITFPTTRLDLAQEKLSPEEHTVLYDTSAALASFDLTVDALSQINKLKALSYSCADRPVSSITFESANGVLHAYDGVFDYTLDADYKGGDFCVKISKSLLDLVNGEDHKVYLCPTEHNGQTFDRFVFQSKHSSIKAADVAILLQELNTDELGENFDGGESWENQF